MLTLNECTKNILCVDCTEESCLQHGKNMADCPKYHCDNKQIHDCEHCDFIKEYQEGYRKAVAVDEIESGTN